VQPKCSSKGRLALKNHLGGAPERVWKHVRSRRRNVVRP
jgi:hypothetical protein